MGRFAVVCRRRGLKVNAAKCKVMVLGEEGLLKCEVCIDGICLELRLKFKYLVCVLDESGIDEAECSRRVASGRRVTGAVRSLVNTRSLQLECARVLEESLLVPVHMYGSETMIWREKERSRIRAVQMDMRRMNEVPNAQIRQLCGVTKGIDEKIDEGVLQWFCHVERMENGMITKRVYVGECASSRSMGRPRKRWIDTVKDCLKKRGLDVRQVRRMVQDMSVWRGFVRGNAWGVARGMNP